MHSCVCEDLVPLLFFIFFLCVCVGVCGDGWVGGRGGVFARVLLCACVRSHMHRHLPMRSCINRLFFVGRIAVVMIRWCCETLKDACRCFVVDPTFSSQVVQSKVAEATQTWWIDCAVFHVRGPCAVVSSPGPCRHLSTEVYQAHRDNCRCGDKAGKTYQSLVN